VKTEKSKAPKYRTIKQCYELIKQLDAETAISEWFIRQICKKNSEIYIANGSKSLVNYTELLKYLGYTED